ncbi:hypothetical protein ASG73_05990 [Janibacter sp. Soil728]|uniref:hypothetical protein n=1 Tax=Janibacter sp. Soil728 TaxID=1736393 RepID=UPI0006F67066|nr:hypothetical protein [Janibacter sp. Soil728]KRE38478.1 hypothetical protein ASG73_05990 [Janibacter sp. Soil728]
MSSLLTLLLIAPAAAVLASRVHGLVAIGQPDGSICSGTDLLWPIVQLGLPAIAMIIAIPVALLSLAHRARGWLWLTGALLGTLLLEVALRLWVPGCS